MFGLRQNRDIPILNEYKQILEEEWTRPVACQNECGPDESCYCLRHLVHVDALKAWWKRNASESGKQTQLQRLLDEMPPAGTFPLDFQKLFKGEHSCLRVFSLLLKQERGHLIESFYDSDMNDKYLERSGDEQSLYDNLVGVTHPTEAGQIIKDFHWEKWAYCPLDLTLYMDRNLQGTKVIPPFCRKDKVSNKGGTASIYFVAIQRDLIKDERLKLALQDSLYDDPDYGKCYKMALKSYCGNKKSAYDDEKSAFSALRSSNEVPIVQYLGCYTHDYGEGIDMGKTYNLLLEFGEKDLYESWADETNVPPVLAQEIVRFWGSLFDVAHAIRSVHHLEIPHGKNAFLKYDGWHADIKPDNILLVHGKLKLADFGFSRFARAIQRQNGYIPTEFINGWTDTYGAPEVSRMKRTDGTLTGVTQSIDTWSFGCVLSVAATWVVLGFQGVRQYEQLRRLSNLKRNAKRDRFHDGSEVLPEVREWHNLLRGHMRPSDTLTSMVLEVVEDDMLQKAPSDRYDFEQLCEKLEELTHTAERSIRLLKRNSRVTNPMVLKALLMFEEAAENRTLSQAERSDSTFQLSVDDDIEITSSRQKTSRQIEKAKAIKKKPLGQTAFRRDIIKDELRSTGNYWEEPKQTNGERHDGAITDSPIDTRSSMDMLFPERKARRRNPKIESSNSLATAVERVPPPEKTYIGLVSTQDSERASTDYPQTPREFVQGPPPEQTKPYYTPKASPESARFNRKSVKEISTPVGWQSPDPSWQASPPRSSPRIAKPLDSPIDSPSPATYPVESSAILNSPSPFTPVDGLAIVPPPGWSSGHPARSYSQTVPQILPPTRSRYTTNNGPGSSQDHMMNTQTETSSKPGPSITLSHPGQNLPFVNTYHDGLLSVEEEYPTHLPSIFDPSNGHVNAWPPVPPSVYDLPFPICRKRKELDQEVTKRIGKWKGKFGLETRTKDASLASTFSEPRELVLVIDNGWTMFTHWPIATFVAETLAKNAAGLDKSGFDVRFTIEGWIHNKDDLKGDTGRNDLKTALRNAWPRNDENEHSLTDMGDIFAQLSNEWVGKGHKATTLLVLTDGVWSKTDKEKLNQTILNIAKRDNRHTGNRHFSIQFVRFGDERREMDKLQWLDDELCTQANFRDIIDHCSWRSDVDKIFKGSIEGYQDQNASPEPANPFHYPDLVRLFSNFNGGSLSPPQELQRSSSRSSSHSRKSSSKSGSDFWRNSMPLGSRRDSWQTQPRTPFSA